MAACLTTVIFRLRNLICATKLVSTHASRACKGEVRESTHLCLLNCVTTVIVDDMYVYLIIPIPIILAHFHSYSPPSPPSPPSLPSLPSLPPLPSFPPSLPPSPPSLSHLRCWTELRSVLTGSSSRYKRSGKRRKFKRRREVSSAFTSHSLPPHFIPPSPPSLPLSGVFSGGLA